MTSELKEIFDEKGVTTRGGTASLATGGKPITATLGKPKSKPPPFLFSNDEMTKLQLKMGTSDNKLKILANFIRQKLGRASIQHLQKYLTERNQKLSEFFDLKDILQTVYVSEEDDTGARKKKKTTTEVSKIYI